eukprot:143858-Prorocentrum_lima.AAC.1
METPSATNHTPVAMKRVCCFCLGTYYAAKMYLFIDHEKTIKVQESQKTLRTPTNQCPYKKDMNVNFLTPFEQDQRLKGPEKDH